MAKKVTVSFDVIVPDVEHTSEELEEWLRFEFGDNGNISLSNPFEACGFSAEPEHKTFTVT